MDVLKSPIVIPVWLPAGTLPPVWTQSYEKRTKLSGLQAKTREVLEAQQGGSQPAKSCSVACATDSGHSRGAKSSAKVEVRGLGPAKKDL